MNTEEFMTGNSGECYKNNIILFNLPEAGMSDLSSGIRVCVHRRPGAFTQLPSSGNGFLVSGEATGVNHGGI